MSLDIQEAQRSAIMRMLDLKIGNDSDLRRLDAVPQWKVLIYDKVCQDIIAPILRVCLHINPHVTHL